MHTIYIWVYKYSWLGDQKIKVQPSFFILKHDIIITIQYIQKHLDLCCSPFGKL